MSKKEPLFLDIKPAFDAEHIKNIDYLVKKYVDDTLKVYNEINGESFENSLEEILNNDSIKKTIDEAYGYLKKNTRNREFSLAEEEMIKFGVLTSIIYHDKDHRKTGGYYFKHPFEIAIDLAKSGEDYITITAALLHDTIEEKLKTARKSKQDITREDLIRGLEKTLNRFYSINKTDLFEDSAFEYYQLLRLSYSKRFGKDLDIELNKTEKEKLCSLIKKQTKELPLRLVRRLSRSNRLDYRRYKSNIFSESVIKKDMVNFLKEIGVKVPGLSKIYRKMYNYDVIIRTSLIKLADVDNNLERLSVADVELEELIKSGIIKDGVLIRNGVFLQNKKKQFIDYLRKPYKVQLEQKERKEYSWEARVLRYLAHFLDEKHILTGFNVTKNIFHTLFKYKSISSEKRFEYYTKSWWLRNETAKYLDQINTKNNLFYFGNLIDRLDYSHSVALETKRKHSEHLEYHLKKSDKEKWDDLIEFRYIPEEKHKEIAEPMKGELIPYDGTNIFETNEHNRLEGVAHNLSKKVLKEREEGKGRKIEISRELIKDRAFQYGILLAMIEIDKEYLKTPKFYFGDELFE